MRLYSSPTHSCSTRPQCPEREDAATWQKGGWFFKKPPVLFLRFQIVSARTPLFIINLVCLSLRLAVGGMLSAFCCRKLQSCCEAGPKLRAPFPRSGVSPPAGVVLNYAAANVHLAHCYTSLPRNSCEFSKSTQKSYLFCTFIWDRTSWSKLRNTPAALLGPFSQLENKKMRVGMRSVFHGVGGFWK